MNKKQNSDNDDGKAGELLPEKSASKANREVDGTSFDWRLTRRELMHQAALASLLFALPWENNASAAGPSLPKLPSFVKNKTGDGIIGPYGEVRVARGSGVALPGIISAAGGLALMNMATRTPFVRFGMEKDKTAITLTADGVQFGTLKPEPWSDVTVKKMIKSLTSDRNKARGAMLLRSALYTSYPAAAQQFKSGPTKKMAAAMAKGKAGYGPGALLCPSSCVTTTREITEPAAVVKTALEQWQECYDKAVVSSNCKAAGQAASFLGSEAAAAAAALCAGGSCVLSTLEDIIVGWVEIVVGIVEEVTCVVVSCIKAAVGVWPNPWDLSDLLITRGAVAQPKATFGQKEIDGALKLLKEITGFLGPFKCLLDGKWSLAQLETPLNLGGGNIVIPYGVKLCFSGACAGQIATLDTAGLLAGSWVAALSTWAALDAAAAAQLAGVGVVASPVAAAAVATLTASVGASAAAAIVAAASIILCFILLALLWGSLIGAQLLLCGNDDLSNGVCLVHATFATALISLFTLGILSITQLLPPVVEC
ncbi:MAG: hypothetical protein V2B19_10435 [Pseudomonadota bacterium]